MRIEGVDIPINYKSYDTPPQFLDCRTNFSEEEMKILRKGYSLNVLSGALTASLIFGSSLFFGIYLLSLKEIAANSITYLMLLAFGIIFMVSGFSYALKILLRYTKKDFGVCDGVLLETFQAIYRNPGARRGSSRSCVSAWFPYTGQYCSKIKYGGIKDWNVDNYNPGDEVKVYRINQYEVFAMCSPRQYRC